MFFLSQLRADGERVPEGRRGALRPLHVPRGPLHRGARAHHGAPEGAQADDRSVRRVPLHPLRAGGASHLFLCFCDVLHGSYHQPRQAPRARRRSPRRRHRQGEGAAAPQCSARLCAQRRRVGPLHGGLHLPGSGQDRRVAVPSDAGALRGIYVTYVVIIYVMATVYYHTGRSILLAN